MKKNEFEPADSLHKNWQNYANKHDTNKDVDVLAKLLSTSLITRNEEEVLDALYDSALAVVDATPQLTSEQKTSAQYYFSYNLCTCDECQKTCGAHINKKGQIRISKNFFQNTQNQQTSAPDAFLEIMYTIVHQMLHGIFPELDEETTAEKTEQIWESGMNELKQELAQ